VIARHVFRNSLTLPYRRDKERKKESEKHHAEGGLNNARE